MSTGEIQVGLQLELWRKLFIMDKYVILMSCNYMVVQEYNQDIALGTMVTEVNRSARKKREKKKHVTKGYFWIGGDSNRNCPRCPSCFGQWTTESSLLQSRTKVLLLSYLLQKLSWLFRMPGLLLFFGLSQGFPLCIPNMQFCIHLSQLHLISYHPPCIRAFFMARLEKMEVGNMSTPEYVHMNLAGETQVPGDVFTFCWFCDF